MRSVSEIRKQLRELLYEHPEWVTDEFRREHADEYELREMMRSEERRGAPVLSGRGSSGGVSGRSPSKRAKRVNRRKSKTVESAATPATRAQEPSDAKSGQDGMPVRSEAESSPEASNQSMWTFGDSDYDCVACGCHQNFSLPYAEILDEDTGQRHKVCYFCGASLLLLSRCPGEFHSFRPGSLSFHSPLMANRVRRTKWAVLATMQSGSFPAVDALLKMKEDGRTGELEHEIERLNLRSSRDAAKSRALANRMRRS